MYSVRKEIFHINHCKVFGQAQTEYVLVDAVSSQSSPLVFNSVANRTMVWLENLFPNSLMETGTSAKISEIPYNPYDTPFSTLCLQFIKCG
jgi:hypothetical protein